MASEPAEVPLHESLHESLLHGPPCASERRPTSRWAYPLGAILLASVFVLYHASVLVIWNTPGKGLDKTFHSTFLTKVKGNEYFRGTRLTQSWGMFAPNPNRSNTFVRVFVEDQQGQVWDFEQDIWEEDRYPYIWYDRRGKVNRNIDGKKHLQRIYGAWVCREWERIHGGEQAKSVTFIKRWTVVPRAEEVIKKGGWNQWEAPYKQVEQETITCKTVVHGTLPNELRERYGLPLIDEEKDLRPVVQRTWWDQRERERKVAEQAAALERHKAKVNAQTSAQKVEHDEPPVEEDSPDQ
jgi:hypothetical protein